MTQRQTGPANRSATQDVADTAKHQVSQAADTAKEKARETADEAERRAKTMLADRKGRAADELGGVAQAARQTGQQLRGQDRTTIAEYADTAADRIDQVSGYLRDRSIGELIDDAERLARREPELFLIGAFALGLIGSRFLKSSRQRAGARQDRSYTEYRRSEHGIYPAPPERSYGTVAMPRSEMQAAPGTRPGYSSRRGE